MKTKKILIAPLDWGLGHTTRCMPIIKYLLAQKHQVYAAAEGNAAMLLKANFPNLEIIPLKGYNIEYAKSKNSFVFKILRQLPKIIKTIKAEHQWLATIQKKYQFDGIISDNRYGLYHKGIKNIILTHQVQILSGFGALADKIMLSWHRKQLERFDQCWIVDSEASPGLSGILAHPHQLPKNASYIAWLSQFEAWQSSDIEQVPNHFLILLSGPEPMRSHLEAKLWQQCNALSQYTFSFVAGKPDVERPKDIPKHIKWYSHLAAQDLGKEILQSCGIICRGGYTTLMDLQILRRPALLIPTPGQTEQVYLAEQLSRSNEHFLMANQENFDLKKELAKLIYLPNLPKTTPIKPIFEKSIDKWLNC